MRAQTAVGQKMLMTAPTAGRCAMQVCSNRMIHKTQHTKMHYVRALYSTCILSTLNITKQMHCLLLVHCVHVQGMHMYIHTDKEKYDCVIAQIAHQNIHID